MIMIAIYVVFPEWCGEEPYEATFPLWDGYGCHDAEAAHALVLHLLAGPGPVVLLDAEEGVWDFDPETVRTVLAWETVSVRRCMAAAPPDSHSPTIPP